MCECQNTSLTFIVVLSFVFWDPIFSDFYPTISIPSLASFILSPIWRTLAKHQYQCNRGRYTRKAEEILSCAVRLLDVDMKQKAVALGFRILYFRFAKVRTESGIWVKERSIFAWAEQLSDEWLINGCVGDRRKPVPGDRNVPLRFTSSMSISKWSPQRQY